MGDCAVLVHNVCITEGGGHGSEEHMKAINNKIEELEKSGKYSRIYGNRALKTVGLNGNQRPDITAFRNDGVIEIYEYASPSQAKGYGQNKLVKKMDTMKNNNRGSEGILYEWGKY